MEDKIIKVRWHHGLKFSTHPRLHYAGGGTEIAYIDCDHLSIPELMFYIRKFGYNSCDGVWYKTGEDGQFILLNSDNILLEISKNFNNGDTVHFYVTHGIDTPIINETAQQGSININKADQQPSSDLNEGVSSYLPYVKVGREANIGA